MIFKGGMHILILALTLLAGCRFGGKVTYDGTPYREYKEVPIVEQPTVVLPASNPFYSQASFVEIEGFCMVGDILKLEGSDTQETVCQSDSSYKFTVLKTSDGVYPFQVTQLDLNGNASISTPVVWIRKTSVTAPTITQPAANPFLSAGSSLNLSGACETGSTVSLAGDGAGSTVCLNSAYSLNLPKASDGDYTIRVISVDPAGNSAETSIEWRKHALEVSPSTASIRVNTPQVFTITGGSGSYTLTLSANPSGGSLNTSTKTYTSGQTAYVTDTLTVTDSLGVSQSVNITTLAGDPDHIEILSGDDQTVPVGTAFPEPLIAKLADEYGNGIPSYPLVVVRTSGDATHTGSAIRITDTSGTISIPATMGYSSLRSTFRVAPLSGSLPDLAGSGGTTVSFKVRGSTFGTSLFGTAFTAGNTPVAMVVANLVDNGFGDMAVLNQAENTVGILIGRGNGLFGKMKTYGLGACSGGSKVLSGDLNEDGHLDLAVSCSGSGQISRLHGNGDGSFAIAQVMNTVAVPSGLVVADLNGDGHLDLATASMQDNIVAVHYGTGSGSFGLAEEFPVGNTPMGIASVDLNEDSKVDLVVANSASGNIGVLFRKTDGTYGDYEEAYSGSGLNSVTTSDVDLDGHPDLLTTNSVDTNLIIFYGDGMGNLTTTSSLTTGLSPTSVVVTDLDRDGKKDLVVSNTDDYNLGTFYGVGTRQFSLPRTDAVRGSPVSLVVQDSNADSIPDIYFVDVANSILRVLPGNPLGQLDFITPVGNNPAHLVSGDFDHDGSRDVIVVNQGANSLTVLEGLGNGHLVLKSTVATGTQPVWAEVADLNRDGKQDLVVVNKGGNSAGVFIGKGDLTFEIMVPYATGDTPTGVTVGDFNRDGHLDLVTSNQSTSKISLLTGNGDGTFNLKVDSLTGSAPAGIVAGDFDVDGFPDLATVNYSDGSVSILISNPDGSFRAPVNYPTGGLPTGLVSGYFNNDLLLDLAVTNFGDGTISVLHGISDGAFGAQVVYSIDATPGILAAGDWNGKGRTDLMVALNTQNRFGFLPSMAGGQFSNSPEVFEQAGAVSAVSGTDLNGDGKLDVLVVDGTNGLLQVQLGH